MNLVEILKNCPKGTKLYSPLFGYVSLVSVDSLPDTTYPIAVRTNKDDIESFSETGLYFNEFSDTECLLFPSQNNKDWSTFKVPVKKFNILELKPFDKVLVRDSDNWDWMCGLFSHYFIDAPVFKFRCVGQRHVQCIPYNEETKHLLGTTNMPPQKYINW